MTAYYNEIENFAAQWLRNLIAAGHIAPGEVARFSMASTTSDAVEAAAPLGTRDWGER